MEGLSPEKALKLYDLINELKILSEKKDEIIDNLVAYVDNLEQENAALREEIANIRG